MNSGSFHRGRVSVDPQESVDLVDPQVFPESVVLLDVVDLMETRYLFVIETKYSIIVIFL